jgi:hypothetical protein
MQNTTLQQTTEPISSTIIENKPYNLNELINPAFESSRVDDISNISVSNETLCNSSNNNETEKTRHQSSYYSMCNETTDINYESLTIVNDNKNKSPINNFKSNQFDISINSISECLHSTKISSDYSQCNFTENKFQSLSPKHSLDLSMSLQSLNDSPILSSSHIDSDHPPVNPSNELSMIDSLISNLSIASNDNDACETTRVCTTNYEATFVDDVSVQYADTVRILKDNNDEWLYVQVLNDGRTGFVPKTIVLDLNQFILQLRQHRDQLTKSKVSLLDFPIKV